MFKQNLYRWLVPCFIFSVLLSPILLTAIAVADINDQVAQIGTGPADFSDAIVIFGQPSDYRWGKQRFKLDALPVERYWVWYPGSIHIFMRWDQADMLEIVDSAYVFDGKIPMGSSLERVLSIVGQPKKTVVGRRGWEDGVLYKDINGKIGWCLYRREDLNADFTFLNYSLKTVHIFLETKSSPHRRKMTMTTTTGGKQSFQAVKPIESVKEFDDVRWKDMSKLDLSGRKALIATLRFNKKTVWTEQAKMPPGSDPNKILTAAMNPGLGVRELHKQGITGKGVNVAIIDQPLYMDHPEFAGKIVAYHDTGCGSESSMHGPAVTSLLVGTNCGTAPDARVYYAAAPSWKRDTAYEARALDWITKQNKNLPASEKIRVVSVSAAPSSPNVRDKNQHMWGRACARAEAAGIMVLDCTRDHGFIGRCWYNARVPESVSQCNPGDPRYGFRGSDYLLVPSAPRTTAEEYDKGDCSYQYCGTGGLSWSIPYCAGVLAMGWQIRLDLSPEKMRELLFESAHEKRNGAKIINPKKFIRLVKNAKGSSAKNEGSSVENQNPIGTWQTVDFVQQIDNFRPGQKSWRGEHFIKKLTFFKDGRTSGVWTWEKGYLRHPANRVKSKYLVKEMGGSRYMFMEWISGDVTRGGQKPWYYVLKKM